VEVIYDDGEQCYSSDFVAKYLNFKMASSGRNTMFRMLRKASILNSDNLPTGYLPVSGEGKDFFRVKANDDFKDTVFWTKAGIELTRCICIDKLEEPIDYLTREDLWFMRLKNESGSMTMGGRIMKRRIGCPFVKV